MKFVEFFEKRKKELQKEKKPYNPNIIFKEYKIKLEEEKRGYPLTEDEKTEQTTT